MTELNELTKKLLTEGYTKENPPEFVRPWNDFYGGWEYSTAYQNKMVFETGCGLLVKGGHFLSGHMSYMGVEWMPENNNPVVRCPYDKVNCEKNHKLLRNSISLGYLVQCRCWQTDKAFEYEKSIDKVHKDIAAERDRLFEEFRAQKKGRVCQFSCHFNEKTKKWEQHYDPANICGTKKCTYCAILGRALSTKKGNVFYDTKVTVDDNTPGLFNQGTITTVTKGIRLLDKNISIDICKIIAEKYPEAILKKYKSRHHSELYFAEYHGIKHEVEILNIRAETRVSRDLEQDLEDIQNGFTVIHESDSIEINKQAKRERAQKALDSKVRKMKKLIAEQGVENLDTLNRIRLGKMLDKGYITEDDLKKKAHEPRPEQLTLF